MLKIVYFIMSEYTNYQRSATLSKMFNGVIFYRYDSAMIIRNDNGFDVPNAITVGSDNGPHTVKAIISGAVKFRCSQGNNFFCDNFSHSDEVLCDN